MGKPELAGADCHGHQRNRLAARDEVNRVVIEWVGSLTRNEVMKRCIDGEGPIGKVNSIADIFGDRQLTPGAIWWRSTKRTLARRSSFPQCCRGCQQRRDESGTSDRGSGSTPTKCSRACWAWKQPKTKNCAASA